MNTININNEITAIINAAKTAISNAGTKDSTVTAYRLAYEAVIKLFEKSRIIQFILCLIIKWAQPSKKKAMLMRDILDGNVRKYGLLRKEATKLSAFYVTMGKAIAYLILRIEAKEPGMKQLRSAFSLEPYNGKASILKNAALNLQGLRNSGEYDTISEMRALRLILSVCYYVGISDPLLCARLYLYRQACRIF